MRLYHTGPEIIKEPDITIGRKNADFGQGFYLTDDLDLAICLSGNAILYRKWEYGLENL